MGLLAAMDTSSDPDLVRLRELEPILREVYRRLVALPQERLREEPGDLAELRLAMAELQDRLGRLNDTIERLAPPAGVR
jgi:hypothetical protein